MEILDVIHMRMSDYNNGDDYGKLVNLDGN